MRRIFVPFLFTLCLVAGAASRPTAAQQALDYLVRGISSRLSAGQVVVDFTVLNSGATLSISVNAYLFDSSGRELATTSVEPLDASESVRASLAAPLSDFPPGSSQTLYAVVGLAQLPPVSQRTLFGNIGSIQVQIPETVVAPLDDSGTTDSITLPGGFTIPPINLRDPATVVILVGIVVVVVVLLWIISVILRLLFSRPPVLPAWQPPYVIMPLIDPNSTNGRRQLWQQHAESDTLPAPCAPGNFMVRKLLIGSDGSKLGGWRVTGLRISQYDRYGRVARSQVVLPKGTVRGLSRAVQRSASLTDSKRAERAVKSTARALTSAALKKTGKQNATLPLALDIRFMGTHGDVRILFELYGCESGSWHEIDHWEPEMHVVNGSIHENFTYTLLGQYPQETRRQYRQRLEANLTQQLALMVQAPTRIPPPEPPAEALDTTESPAVTI